MHDIICYLFGVAAFKLEH